MAQNDKRAVGVFDEDLALQALDLLEPPVARDGAQGVALTNERSLAIDPRTTPLGTPVFLSTTRPDNGQPLNRLMMAQDTGGAIRGPTRADVFFGWGTEAEERAGRMRQPGSLYVLLPR